MKLPLHVSRGSFAFAPIIALVMAFGLTACSMPKLPKVFSEREPAPDAKVFWNSFDQYVRIEPQDGGETTPPNDHPVDLATAQIKTALGQIDIQLDKNEEPKPVFSEGELDKIAPAISTALARAGAREDVAVAVAGYHSWVYLFNTKRVNTARIFHRDGKLHVIFRSVLGEYVEGEDRRISPLRPGSRVEAAQFEGNIRPRGTVAFVPGRSDWVTVATRIAPGPRAPSEQPVAERSGAVGGTARITWAELEEGLESLNRLREKGLITNQEYEVKKREMLDALGPW